jgi:hypothetical protein
MAILNYTTQIDVYKTVAEIEKILSEHGVMSIMKQYEDGQVVSLSFLIDDGEKKIPVRMPIRVDECLKVMQKQKKEHPKMQIKATKEQASKVAWRIMKDWIEVQMALLEINMVRFEEIFLPYIETTDGKTIYEKLEERKFLLE